MAPQRLQAVATSVCMQCTKSPLVANSVLRLKNSRIRTSSCASQDDHLQAQVGIARTCASQRRDEKRRPVRTTLTGFMSTPHHGW